MYLSNESNEPIYFDNFRVTHNRGRIIEENHYYAYGLRIAAISSKKVGEASEGHLDNHYLYQGAFSEMDEDIGWQDFALRNYDPQTGRWVQQDPYQQFPSPYVGMGDDPGNGVDPDGGSTLGWLVPTATQATTAGSAAATGLNFFAEGSHAMQVFTATLSALNAAIRVCNQINTSVSTQQAGGPYFDPKGNELAIDDKNSPELYDGSAVSVGQNVIQPYKSAVRAFTIYGDDVDNGAIRFVALFNTENGSFTGYGWDKEKSYTYNDYLKDVRDDLIEQIDHQHSVWYQHYNSPEEARKSLVNLGLSVVLPNYILKVGIGAANATKTAANESSSILKFTVRQLQAKFKHAADFGLAGNYSKVNAAKFSAAINRHINSVGVKVIRGTYKGQPVIHYLNPTTGVNVISKTTGEFISGWKLGAGQLQGVLNNGTLW